MPDARRTDQAERDETPSERADRNFAELVQELRVAQTGVQILFAFLLTLAFYDSFPRESQVFVYLLVVALIASACSALCFMAPVAVHRLTFRRGGKEHIVWVTHRLALTGMSLLAVAMLCAIWIVVAFLLSGATATVVVAGLATLVLTVWVLLPMRLRAAMGGSAD